MSLRATVAGERFANPHDVTTDEDRIQTPPTGVENWSENINFCCHTGTPGTGIYAHMSRMCQDPSVWEGVVAIYLPNQELLISRSFGRAQAPDEASSGQLTFRCEDPLERWTMSFDGMAQRVGRSVPPAGTVRDGSVEPVLVNLTLDAASPVWSLGAAMSDQPWGSLHLEQAVRVRGQVVAREFNVEVDHVAFRDHTAGQRDYGPLDGEAWLTCAFPSGRMFAVLEVWHAGEVSRLTTGFYYDGARFHTITDLDVPVLAGPSGTPAEFEFTFDGPDGPLRVVCNQEHSMVFMLDEPIGMPLGTNLDRGLIAVEGPGRYTLDGETALGWVERCRRVSQL
jgi:hypothetical protein